MRQLTCATACTCCPACCPPGVTLLDPRTRCFSELPSWLEAAAAPGGPLASAGGVLMYCTGGVRCERASALLRELLAEVGCDSQYA